MSDAVIALAQRIRARDDAAAGNIASNVSPDALGRANVLSRDLSLPPDLVDRNLSAVERVAIQAKARSTIAQHPVIGEWAADARHAGLAQDDMDSLSNVAKTVGGYLSAGVEHSARALGAGVPRATAGLWGLGRMAFEGLAAADRWTSGQQGATVLDTAANWMKRQQDAGDAMAAQAYGSEPDSFIASNMKQGVTFLDVRL